jgi:hypothetical protein
MGGYRIPFQDSSRPRVLVEVTVGRKRQPQAVITDVGKIREVETTWTERACMRITIERDASGTNEWYAATRANISSEVSGPDYWEVIAYDTVACCPARPPHLRSAISAPGGRGVDKDPRTDSATSEIRPSRSRVDRSPGKSFAIPRSNRFRKTRLRGARYSRRDKHPGTNQDNTTTMLGHPAGNRSISPVDGPQHEPYHGCRPAPTLGRSRRLEASGEARSGGLHCREGGSPSHESTDRAQRECHGAQARQDRDKRPAMLPRSARLGRREDCGTAGVISRVRHYREGGILSATAVAARRSSMSERGDTPSSSSPPNHRR